MIKNLLDSDEEPFQEAKSSFGNTSGLDLLNLFEDTFDEPGTKTEPNSTPEFIPPTKGETARMMGLAWSAAISLFGSVAFMLTIGWLMDLLLGSSPWGIVGGVVLGSIIGFIQFFRINAAIFRHETGQEHTVIIGHFTESTQKNEANSVNRSPEPNENPTPILLPPSSEDK